VSLRFLITASVVAASLVLVCGSSAAAATQPDETLGSAACRQAMATVQQQEDQALAAARRRDQPAEARVRSAVPSALLDARRKAAQACLRDRADPAQPQLQGRLAQPPIEVAPIRVPLPTRPAPAPGLAGGSAGASVGPSGSTGLPPVPRSAPPAPVIVGCDAYGCNASDGTRVNRSGPNLIGPRGLCVQQGVQLICP
jgi:hypothetical protein